MFDGEWDYFPRQPRPDWSAWRRPAVLRCDWLVVGGGWLVVTGGWRPRRGWCQDQTAGGSPAERSAPAEMEMAQYYAGGAPGNLNLNHTNNNVISMKVGHSRADIADRSGPRHLKKQENSALNRLKLMKYIFVVSSIYLSIYLSIYFIGSAYT